MKEDYFEVWMDMTCLGRFDSYEKASQFCKGMMRNHKTEHFEIQTYFKEEHDTRTGI